MTHKKDVARQHQVRLLIGIGAGIVAISAIWYLLLRDSAIIRFLATDWLAIDFATESRSSVPGSVGDAEGGQVLGLSQVVSIESNSIGQRVMETTISKAEFALVSTSGWRTSVDLDRETSEYYLTLRRIDTGEVAIQYRPPFDQLPELLRNRITYRSTQPETLIIEPPEDTNNTGRIEILSNTRASWVWNLRGDCQVTALRDLYPHTSDTTTVDLTELCSNATRHSDKPASDANRVEDGLEVWITYELAGGRAVLILPSSQKIHTENSLMIEDSEAGYLILLYAGETLQSRPKGSESAFWIDPIASSDRNDSHLPAMIIQANATRFELRGLVGKVAVGQQRFLTDELSDIEVKFDSRPGFQWHDRTLTPEGTGTPQTTILVGQGEGHMAAINGEHVILSRWEKQSPEIRAAVVGGLMAALISLAVALWEARRRENIPGAATETPATEQTSTGLLKPRAGTLVLVLITGRTIAGAVKASPRLWHPHRYVLTEALIQEPGGLWQRAPSDEIRVDGRQVQYSFVTD